MYARVEDGQVVATRLPSKGRVGDGATVANYHALDHDTLLAEGWLPLEDPGEPDHEPTEHAVHDGYDVEADRVVRRWRIEPLPVTAEDRISGLEAEVSGMRNRAAATEVTDPDAAKVRDAVAGPA